MVVVRAGSWDEDGRRIAAIDTSFSTDRVYRVMSDELGFRLHEEQVAPPIGKRYDVPPLTGPGLVVAEIDDELVGFGHVTVAAWNRRATIEHLHVALEHRGRGVGRALVDALAGRARAAGARCLWLETQNVNYPAIRFYRRLGFRLCGLDETLYDPAETPGEVALFFARDL